MYRRAPTKIGPLRYNCLQGCWYSRHVDSVSSKRRRETAHWLLEGRGGSVSARSSSSARWKMMLRCSLSLSLRERGVMVVSLSLEGVRRELYRPCWLPPAAGQRQEPRRHALPWHALVCVLVRRAIWRCASLRIPPDERIQVVHCTWIIFTSYMHFTTVDDT